VTTNTGFAHDGKTRHTESAAMDTTYNPSLPFRLTVRKVPKAALAARNASEHRVGVARFRVAGRVVEQIRRATGRSVTAGHVATWAAHPDERVAIVLAVRAGGLPSPNVAGASAPQRVEDLLVARALADAAAEGVAWTPLMDTLCVQWEWERERERNGHVATDEPVENLPAWAIGPLTELAEWAGRQESAAALVPLLGFEAETLQLRVWAATPAVDAATLTHVLTAPHLGVACAAAHGLAENAHLAQDQLHELYAWALRLVTPSRRARLDFAGARHVAQVLQTVGAANAPSSDAVRQLRKAATAKGGDAPAACAATAALLASSWMSEAALEELLLARSSAVFGSGPQWPALRDYLEHPKATPTLWRLAAREAVRLDNPLAMTTAPIACRDPEVRNTLYASRHGRTVAALWTDEATTVSEFVTTFGALARRAAVPNVGYYYDLPETLWAALTSDHWGSLLDRAGSRRIDHPHIAILARIPAARRDPRMWALARRGLAGDKYGPRLEPAMSLAADPEAAGEDERHRLLLECLVADVHSALADVDGVKTLTTLLRREDLVPAFASKNAEVRASALRVLAQLPNSASRAPEATPARHL